MKVKKGDIVKFPTGKVEWEVSWVGNESISLSNPKNYKRKSVSSDQELVIVGRPCSPSDLLVGDRFSVGRDIWEVEFYHFDVVRYRNIKTNVDIHPSETLKLGLSATIKVVSTAKKPDFLTKEMIENIDRTWELSCFLDRHKNPSTKLIARFCKLTQEQAVEAITYWRDTVTDRKLGVTEPKFVSIDKE